jgi:Sulfotransferase family
MELDNVLKERIGVIFIGGYGRSGSTLLDRVLGQEEGFFSAGELHHVWERGFLQNELCGCGEPFRDCAFWSNVTEEAFPDFSEDNVKRILDAKRVVDRTRFVPLVLFPVLQRREFARQLQIYREALLRLYRGVQHVSGCRMIIDSSKDPVHGFMLRSMGELELGVIHLVRDSRAVAYSWSRHKVRPEIHWTREEMPRFTALQSAITWDWMNLATGVLLRASPRGLRLKYERFATSPRTALAEVLASLAQPANDSQSITERNTVSLAVSHTVAGNPLRFQRGTTRIEPDEEWCRRLSRSERLAVTVVTAPLLRLYGYPLQVMQSR